MEPEDPIGASKYCHHYFSFVVLILSDRCLFAGVEGTWIDYTILLFGMAIIVLALKKFLKNGFHRIHKYVGAA